MEIPYEQLRTAALALPEGTRLHLADDLYESVKSGAIGTEDGSELSPEFKAELDRRADDFISGRDPGVAWEDVQEEVRAILAER